MYNSIKQREAELLEQTKPFADKEAELLKQHKELEQQEKELLEQGVGGGIEALRGVDGGHQRGPQMSHMVDRVEGLWFLVV